MKSDLQIRAERAASRFAEIARRPLVVEFAGVPKAGKTTTLTQVQAFLKRCGFLTEMVVERASICPIRDKKHANFNVWTACTTLAQILEKTQDPPRKDDPHILFLDRGIFDSICWITLMKRLERIRRTDRDVVELFLRVDDWRRRISAVIVMLASPEDALKREQTVARVEGRRGSIMNPEVLQMVKDSVLECCERLKTEFRAYKLDTSFGEAKDDPKRTAEVVIDIILALIEEQVKEEVLFLPKARVQERFAGKGFLDASRAHELAGLFRESGTFDARENVEADPTLVQALPIVIVRNASGAVLRLRRREKSQENPLHEKIVIWAGGHVRREDATNGDPLVYCAMREVREELRLNVEFESLHMLGAVYFDMGGSTSKHVGIAYEWRAPSDDVAVALSSAEFFERRGTSLSGSFVEIEKLARDVDEDKMADPWSAELVRECLAKGSFGLSLSLF